VDFDVTDIDMSTLQLEGVTPLRHNITDVSAPAAGEDECDCDVQGPDGIIDLSLKFRKADVVMELGIVNDGDQVPLTLTGSLVDGTQFEASDCILVRGDPRSSTGKGGQSTLVRTGATSKLGHGAPKAFALKQNHPNPFNFVTTISFDVAPGGGQIALRVYDVRGRLVRTLAHGVHPAGQKATTWDGRDDNGNPVASGAYFVRLTAPGFVETRRVVLLK
jgi:hypothetical protein